MKLGLVSFIASVSVCSCSGSSRSTQAQAANAIAHASNEVQPTLIEAYRNENDRCVREAESLDEGKACFVKVDQTFDPVWQGRKSLAAAHDAWADELERGAAVSPSSAERLITAWCTLRRVVPPAVQLPKLPVPCESTP
jgi:hypothetical protein